MSVLVACKFDEDTIKTKDAIISILGAQWQVTPNLIFGSSWNSNISENLCLSWSRASLMKIRSKLKALSCPQHFLHYKYIGKVFDAQWHVTLEPTVRSHPKSNSSEIWCLSSFPARLKKIRSKMKVYRIHNIFQITCLWELLVAMKTRVFFFLSNMLQNLLQPFPHPSDATH